MSALTTRIATRDGNRSRALLAFIAVVLAAANVVAFYPGMMGNDALNQFREAKSGSFTDWHPPMMAILWSYMNRISEGPQGMYLFQVLLHWLGFWILADGLARTGRNAAAWIILACGLFPMFPVFNREVLKDVHMASTFLVSFALVWRDRAVLGTVRSGVLAIALLLATYGMLMRTNAAFALGPLLLYLLVPAGRLKAMAAALVAGLLCVAAIPASSWINRHVLEARESGSMLSLQIFDLAGVAVRSGDDELVKAATGLELAKIEQCYTVYWWDGFSDWGRCAQAFGHARARSQAEPGAVTRLWLDAIKTHPGAWTAHRLAHLNSSIYFLVPAKHFRYAEPRTASEPVEFEKTTPTLIARNLVSINPLLWPITWIAVGGMLLVTLKKAESSNDSLWAARMLVLSALGYSLAYLVVGVATVMRYHYWSEMAILVAIVLTAPRLAETIRSDRALRYSTIAVLAIIVAAGLVFRIADIAVFV